jgi:hypothetical protein
MAGTYNLVVANAYGSATSAVARLTVAMAPIVLSQPRDLVATNGDVVVFSVTAQGTAPLSYQWFLNETVPLAGATGSELNLGRVALAQAGRYSVVVTNAYGTVASTLAQLTVVSGPEIQSQPKDREVSRGSSASFDVVATGNPAPSFQWLLNGTPVPDATNASLVIDNVQEPNLGLYSVVVSNSVRSITSAPARLSLLEGPPRILAQPSDATAIPGGTARFSVSVFSTTPVSCQWYFNGDQPVSGATSETLDLAAISIAQRGSYHVALSNEFGVTLSASAQLRVLVKPEMLYFSRVGDLVTFTFSTETNLLYTLYYADQPNPGNWILMPKPAPQRPGNGLPMSIQDPKATNGGRFYKILVE